jgi:HEAT repeat protein
MALRNHLIALMVVLGIFSLSYASPKVNTDESKNPDKSSAKKSVDEWIEILRTGTEEERRKSIESLQAIKPLPKSALPALIEVVETCRETVACPALYLIQAFGTEAKECAPVLLRLLKESEKNPRDRYLVREIAATLAKIDTQPHLEVTQVLMFFGEGKRGHRLEEFWLYAYRFPIRVTEHLLTLLRGEENVRRLALHQLSKYHEAKISQQKSLFEFVEPKMHLITQLESLLDGSQFDQKLFPILVQLDPQTGIDHLSLTARGMEQGWLSPTWIAQHFKPKAKEILPTIIHGLRKSTSPNITVYQSVILQWPYDLSWPSLQRALHDRDPQMRYGAIATLGQMLRNIRFVPRLANSQVNRREIGKELELAIQDSYGKARLHALVLLASNYPESRDRLVQPLIPFLDHSDETLQLDAIRTLGEIGPPAYGAIPALFQVLKTAQGEPRYSALNAIVSIDVSKSDRVLEDIRVELKNGLSYDSGKIILDAIQKMGPRAKVLTSDILKGIENQPVRLAVIAADTLDRIAPDQPAFAIQALRQILMKIPGDQHADHFVQLLSERLFRQGEKANSLAPLIEELRPQCHPEIQSIFSLALFAIDPKNRTKYGKEIQEVILHQPQDLSEILVESSGIQLYLKDLLPVFLETLKHEPTRANFFANVFREIGKPMCAFLPELKAFENQLPAPQKNRWNRCIKELEAIKESKD